MFAEFLMFIRYELAGINMSQFNRINLYYSV